MSFMDIMNIMKVSSSKFVFTLIAVAALFVGGSGIMAQDAYAANAPEFTAIHLNTTMTKVTFDQNVNGTLRILDWSIKTSSTAVAGGTATDVAITDIVNGTNAGIRYDGGAQMASYTDTATAADKTYSGIGAANTGLGFLNNSKSLYLIHAAIPSDVTYFVNYTNNPAASNDYTNGDTGAFVTNLAGGVGWGAVVAENLSVKYLKIGSNATAVDWMPPTVVSADILKSNPSQVRITMSEGVANVNATDPRAFTMTTSGGGNQAVVSGGVGGTNGTSFIYVNLQNPVKAGQVLTISHTMANSLGSSQGDTGNGGFWITDELNSKRHGADATTGLGGGSSMATTTNGGGVGNRAGNFTVSITNWIPVGFDGSIGCYDCSAPTVAAVQVSLDGSTPVTVTDDNPVQINAGTGDTVSVMVTIADNVGADTMTFAGLYTNFGDAPDNLYYANNFDSFKSMSTSYYEWNARADDTAFGNTDAITWDAATATVNPDRTQTITYTMTINDSVESSQVWVDLGDMSNNYAKSALPITLEVAGPPAITFASDDSQQVVSYFNESILLAIVSQWTATSSDDATNVEQLSSILGIEDQLPTWTTSLASWVSDDKIDVADMIVAVEYVINQ
jgi:hypothetical protein